MKSRYERPLPSEAKEEKSIGAIEDELIVEDAKRRESRKRMAFHWLLQQENGRIVWAWLFERCGYNKPVLMRAAGGDVAPLSTECLAAQREVYRELRKMISSPDLLAAAEYEAEFGVKEVKGDK